MTKLEKQVEE